MYKKIVDTMDDKTFEMNSNNKFFQTFVCWGKGTREELSARWDGGIYLESEIFQERGIAVDGFKFA